MEFLGLHYAIWIILVLYFAGMLLLGWWSKRGIHNREGFLLGNRQFGLWYMVMHAFGAGTHPGDVAGVTSKTVERGPSGIWVSWMWMFGTPFYWIIAPVVRRMRCLTMADYFEQRFGRAASVLYVLVATVGMTIAAASILLATTRTVQGMMGKATVKAKVQAKASALPLPPGVSKPAKPAAKPPPPPPGAGAAPAPAGPKSISRAEEEAWFFAILLISTAVFVVYSYWGGIVAAIRTDMIQGLMIIALSFIAIPAAMKLAGGFAAAKETIATTAQAGGATLSLFDPKYFSLLMVLLLCINAPFSMMAQPHLMSVCAAGKTEWEGRVGFTYGNILKRICTMGWCILALCWLAYLLKTGRSVHPDAAFGDSVRELLHPVLQGLMLACVMAAAMSSGDALQVTIAGLFSQNIYRPYLRPGADESHYVQATRIAGVVIIAASLGVAIGMRESVVKTILDYFNLTATVGVAVVMGILWRRMNSTGVFLGTLAAAGAFLVTRYVLTWSQADLIAGGALATQDGACAWGDRAGMLKTLAGWGMLGWRKITVGPKAAPQAAFVLAFTRAATTALPLLAGAIGGIVGSLLTGRPRREVTDKFFTKIYTPIGQEDKLALPLDEAVPAEKRLLTRGGLFLVKPSRQSWVGFLVTLAICLICVLAMLALVR